MMFPLTILVITTQVYFMTFADNTIIKHYSDEELQHGLKFSCKLRKLYKEHKATHILSRPPNEEKTRMDIFLKQIKRILELRADPEVTWDVGLNLFADLSEDERASLKSLPRNATLLSRKVRDIPDMKFPEILRRTPAEKFDKWRKNRDEIKMVSPIRDQHTHMKTNSYAHAAIIPLETQLAFYKKEQVRLSVEELYQCSQVYGSDGSIDPSVCWDYVSDNSRIGYWYDSPETPVKKNLFHQHVRKCEGFDKQPNALRGYKLEGIISANSETRVQQTLSCVGPVVFQMDGKNNELAFYKPLKRPLFRLRNSKCLANDHSMAIVGYDHQKFIVKNSWGETWGAKGYLYLDRSGPACGIFDTTETALLIPDDEDNLTKCRW